MAEIKYLSLAGLLQYDGLIKEYIGKLITAANGDTAAVKALVETLIGDDAEKSVRTIANEELAKLLIPENAKEALDTLQEIAAWIQAHPDDAAAMNAAIEANASAIGAAVPAKGNEGDDDYVPAQPASGLTKRVDDLEALMGTESVEDQIDAAIDALAGSAEGSDAVENTAPEGEPSNAVPAKVTVKVESENGEVSAVTVTTNDIASAADLAALDTKVSNDVQGDTTKTIKDLVDEIGVDPVAASEGVEAVEGSGLKDRISTLEGYFSGEEGTTVAGQILAAIDAITGTLADDDAATLEAVNDELDGIDAALETLNGDEETEGSVAKAVKDLENTEISATSAVEGVSNDVVVTLGGTVGAPTVSVTNNFVAVSEDEIDGLFDDEEETKDPTEEPQA